MGEERRRWARIEASLECTVASEDQTFDAKVVNVSRGGMALLAAAGLVKEGETISVMLEQEEGAISLAVSGTVVRIVGAGDDTVYGVRFEALPPDSEEQLLALLKLLVNRPGQGRRQHPRVGARISVRCKSRERFDALLHDLSRGGFSVRCPAPVEKGSTLSVEFGVEQHAELIVIEGKVVHIETLPDGKHLAGLSFTPPSPEQRAKVHQLLDLLLGLGER
jgi:c-di-GMP-binding flagellar brake protein YcgR